MTTKHTLIAGAAVIGLFAAACGGDSTPQWEKDLQAEMDAYIQTDEAAAGCMFIMQWTPEMLLEQDPTVREADAKRALTIMQEACGKLALQDE